MSMEQGNSQKTIYFNKLGQNELAREWARSAGISFPNVVYAVDAQEKAKNDENGFFFSRADSYAEMGKYEPKH